MPEELVLEVGGLEEPLLDEGGLDEEGDEVGGAITSRSEVLYDDWLKAGTSVPFNSVAGQAAAKSRAARTNRIRILHRIEINV